MASTEPSTTTATAPSGYNLVASVTSGGSNPLATTKVFSHTVVSGDTSVTLTYSTSTTAQAAVLGIYRGVDPNLPVDVTATGSAAATTTVTAPSVTPVYTGDQLLVFQGAAGTFSGSSWTSPSGTAERAQVNTTANVSTGLADQAIGAGATGTRTSTFGRSANLTSVMVAISQPPSVLFLHADQLGSTRMLTDSSGVVRGTYTYDSYGNLVASTGTFTNPLRFAGQYQDSESGLYYLRARYYDPTTGQFLTCDPVLQRTRSPYAYSAGNPLNTSDPSGLLTGAFCAWGGANLGLVYVGLSFCIVADTHGNIGTTVTAVNAVPGVNGFGCCASGGVSVTVQASNAETIYDLAGTFNANGFAAGPFLQVVGEEYDGKGVCGRDVLGGGAGLGLGVGVPVSVYHGSSFTIVHGVAGPGPERCPPPSVPTIGVAPGNQRGVPGPGSWYSMDLAGCI